VTGLVPALLGSGVELGDLGGRVAKGVERSDFEDGLATLPQVIGAVHVTGDYDYEIRVACAHAAEIETVIDVLKREHGVRELRSRLVLGEVPLGPQGLLAGPA
jgi:Lrp/AsnC family transcriptional regulator, leucine-responsive regulatory protein